MADLIQIDIDMDTVTVENQVIKRPAHISRSDWLKFWERSKIWARVKRWIG